MLEIHYTRFPVNEEAADLLQTCWRATIKVRNKS